jgi:hypothetical protein
VNEVEPGEQGNSRVRDRLGDLVDFATELAGDADPGPILDALHAADRAIESAAGAAIRGAGEVLGDAAGNFGDALSSLDLGSVAGAAGEIAEAGADVAGEVLGALAEGIGGALS